MLCNGEITEPLPQKYTYTKIPFAGYNCYWTISQQEWKTLKIGKCSEDGNFTYIGGRLSQWINFEILEFVLGFESWGNKTTTKKQLCYSLLSLKKSSFVLFPFRRRCQLGIWFIEIGSISCPFWYGSLDFVDQKVNFWASLYIDQMENILKKG